VADYSMTAEARSVTGKQVNSLRAKGFVPATIYGPNTEAVNVQFPYRELEVLLRHAGGTHVITITVNGKAIPVLAREVQRDVIKGTILHVDFFAPDMNQKVRAEIPVHYIGESPVVTGRRGIMLTGPNTLTLEMLPSQLLEVINVDVSNLAEIGATIQVKDLHLEGITVINDPEEMIAKIVQPSAARAAEDAAAAAATEGETAPVEE
jgi:large subunit ribosomal protein L25